MRRAHPGALPCAGLPELRSLAAQSARTQSARPGCTFMTPDALSRRVLCAYREGWPGLDDDRRPATGYGLRSTSMPGSWDATQAQDA